MKIEDFKNKRVTVMGLGLHSGGVGVVRFLNRVGSKILVTDLKSKDELKESIDELKDVPVKYVLGQHRVEDFKNTDMIIKNPAVPENSKHLAVARENKVPIETEMGIFFELCPATIIGVTGTKGKSTTAYLISKILKKRQKDVFLGGNIRISALANLDKIKKTSLVVLELSSWQLQGLQKHKKSPQVAVITCLMPDHLNRYKNMEEYIADKKLIFQFQKPNDFLLLNQEDPIVNDFGKEAKSQVIYYHAQQEIEGIHLRGKHNLVNIAAATAIGKLFKISEKKINQVISKFHGLRHRLEFVREINDVFYYNDSASTVPEATIAAINSFDKPIISEGNKVPSEARVLILIAGGVDKNLDYSEMAKLINKKVKFLILLPGDATEKLKTQSLRLKTIEVGNMKQAVEQAKRVAEKGDIVLLSPGAASFNLFKHEFDRGDQFRKYVLEL